MDDDTKKLCVTQCGPSNIFKKKPIKATIGLWTITKNTNKDTCIRIIFLLLYCTCLYLYISTSFLADSFPNYMHAICWSQQSHAMLKLFCKLLWMRASATCLECKSSPHQQFSCLRCLWLFSGVCAKDDLTDLCCFQTLTVFLCSHRLPLTNVQIRGKARCHVWMRVLISSNETAYRNKVADLTLMYGLWVMMSAVMV